MRCRQNWNHGFPRAILEKPVPEIYKRKLRRSWQILAFHPQFHPILGSRQFQLPNDVGGPIRRRRISPNLNATPELGKRLKNVTQSLLKRSLERFFGFHGKHRFHVVVNTIFFVKDNLIFTFLSFSRLRENTACMDLQLWILFECPVSPSGETASDVFHLKKNSLIFNRSHFRFGCGSDTESGTVSLPPLPSGGVGGGRC